MDYLKEIRKRNRLPFGQCIIYKKSFIINLMVITDRKEKAKEKHHWKRSPWLLYIILPTLSFCMVGLHLSENKKVKKKLVLSAVHTDVKLWKSKIVNWYNVIRLSTSIYFPLKAHTEPNVSKFIRSKCHESLHVGIATIFTKYSIYKFYCSEGRKYRETIIIFAHDIFNDWYTC